jgi:hypothetical protein
MAMINVPVGSNFITDYFIGSAIAVDGARSLYHLTKMYNLRNQLPERQRHIIYSFAEIGLLIGNYFAIRKYADKELESEFIKGKDGSRSSEARGIFFANMFLVYAPMLMKSALQYSDGLPTQDKVIDLVADLSILGLVVTRQIITDRMITNVALCNSANRSADCPAAPVINPYSFTL